MKRKEQQRNFNFARFLISVLDGIYDTDTFLPFPPKNLTFLD